ncbi:hypothetical protein SDC9_135155 [bioreactor metagenome]|uniref:Uncharacterized protein n=1 Tax=bioreactor metagenome TaxID=1076179 RepID=A0A645DF29_9ZZZZ
MNHDVFLGQRSRESICKSDFQRELSFFRGPEMIIQPDAVVDRVADIDFFMEEEITSRILHPVGVGTQHIFSGSNFRSQ